MIPYLKQGGTIGFAAPSFGCATEPYKSAFQNAMKQLSRLGFGLMPGPNCYASEGIGISNTPEKCAAELMDMFQRDDVDAIISCGGGEMMCEVVSYLDWEALKKAKPKLYMGYSDNTNFDFLYATLCDGVSIYGPCVKAFGMEPWHESVHDALNVLCGTKTTVQNYDGWQGNEDSLCDEMHPTAPYNCVRKESFVTYLDGSTAVEHIVRPLAFEGRLIGGCLDCLATLVGTRFDRVSEYIERHREEGLVWFLESCDLTVFGIRRAIWQLKEAGWFSGVKGFLIGRPMVYGQEFGPLNQYNAVTDILKDFGVPIIMDTDIGHLPPAMPLLCGSRCRVTVGERLTIEQGL